MDLQNNNSKAPKKISFGEVRVREHERILVNQPENDVYACLALGWAHKSSRRWSLNDLDDEKREETTSTTSREYYYCDDGDDAGDNASSSSSLNSTSSSSPCAPRPPSRYSAPQRVGVLNGYGFDLTEVLKNERERKQKKSAVCSDQQPRRGRNFLGRRRRQRLSSSSSTGSHQSRQSTGSRAVRSLFAWCGLTKKTTTAHY